MNLNSLYRASAQTIDKGGGEGLETDCVYILNNMFTSVIGAFLFDNFFTPIFGGKVAITHSL